MTRPPPRPRSIPINHTARPQATSRLQLADTRPPLKHLLCSIVAIAALQSFRFVSPSSTSASARPPSSTLASVPAGRRESCFPGLSLSHHRSAALRPCVVVRAQSHGGAQQPAAADRYFVEESEHVMKRYREIILIDHGCLVRVPSIITLCWYDVPASKSWLPLL